MPDFSEVSAEFERLLRTVDHAATSTTKYRPFEGYLADLLGIPAGDIYTTHVKKPGNFDVRMTQSPRARDARLLVALLPVKRDLPDVKALAVRIARNRDPGTAVLLVCDEPGWTPRWGVEAAGSGLLSAGPGSSFGFDEWPDEFELFTYPHASAEPLPAWHLRLGATPAEGEGSAFSRKFYSDVMATRARVTEWLYQEDPGLFARFIEDDIAASDVVAISSRQKVLERFRNLLEDPDFFNDAAEPFGGKKEAVWQNLLEENPWILGVSLAGQVLTSWSEDKLEQVVAGFSISGPGKRSDAVMRTNGRIRAMVFAEIKHHKTDLLGKQAYRPGSWPPSQELSGGVVQVQQTVHLAGRQINGRLAETDESGAETGEHTYLVRPRSFLILGHLDQLRGPAGVHRAKYESFELYRRNLYEPEILTFDELLARAEWHVQALDERSDGA